MPKIDNLTPGSSLQRNALNHQAIEDYLKTIYTLAEEESPVSTSRIAQARDVKPGSVTSMLQRLAGLNLVNYEKHYGVTLTPAGTQIALEVIRHHRLIELYLIEALGFEWHEVHEQADILEHVISEKLEERIAAALDYPTLDPHGDPIPTKDGTLPSVYSQSLASIEPGQRARVVRVADDGEMLQYLAEIGLVPGAEITVVSRDPFDGPLTLRGVQGEIAVGPRVAAAVTVELIE